MVDSFALSASLRLRLRLKLDELVPFDAGISGGNIAIISEGNTAIVGVRGSLDEEGIAIVAAILKERYRRNLWIPES